MVLLRIPTAVHSVTGIEGLKYQGIVIHTLVVRDLAAMGSSSFKTNHGPKS